MNIRLILGFCCAVLCLSTFAEWHVVPDIDTKTGKSRYMCINVGIKTSDRFVDGYNIPDDRKPSLIMMLTPTFYDMTSDNMSGFQSLILMTNICRVDKKDPRVKITLDGGTPFVVHGEPGINDCGLFLPSDVIRKISRSKTATVVFSEKDWDSTTVLFNTEGLQDAIDKVKRIVRKTKPRSVSIGKNTNRKD